VVCETSSIIAHEACRKAEADGGCRILAAEAGLHGATRACCRWLSAVQLAHSVQAALTRSAVTGHLPSRWGTHDTSRQCVLVVGAARSDGAVVVCCRLFLGLPVRSAHSRTALTRAAVTDSCLTVGEPATRHDRACQWLACLTHGQIQTWVSFRCLRISAASCRGEACGCISS
jgi:hypothetical protein